MGIMTMFEIELPSMCSKCSKVIKLIINDKFIQQLFKEDADLSDFLPNLNAFMDTDTLTFTNNLHVCSIYIFIFFPWLYMLDVHLYIFTD